MSTGTMSERRAKISARTLRTDRWWVSPLLNAAGLAFFLAYGTFRIFYDQNYWVEEFHYLAPFYSPCLAASCVEGSSHFLGSPCRACRRCCPPRCSSSCLPGGFRATCYYYRKTYYRAFWFSPPACAVAEPHKAYTGETRFPLIIQNVHRYFFYFALLVAGVLTYDAFLAFHGEDGGFGIGLGTVVLWVNVVLIWGYTLGCHSCRQHHRRTAQPLLPAPGPLLGLGAGVQAERQAPAVRLVLALLACSQPTSTSCWSPAARSTTCASTTEPRRRPRRHRHRG